MDKIIVNKKILKLTGKNIRTNKEGYCWGNKPEDSNILLSEEREKYKEFNSIAERWICSDDKDHPGLLCGASGEIYNLSEFFKTYAEQVFGKKHLDLHGHYLGTIMKLIDTNNVPNKGSLSLQIHPGDKYDALPSKPEMWLCLKDGSKIYVGWNQDYDFNKIKYTLFLNEFNIPFLRNFIPRMLNSIDFSKGQAILVNGGVVHAVRYGTFLAEWSKAPTKKDTGKGALKKATIALADNTDGKIPRMAKVNLKKGLEVLKAEQGFKKTEINDLYSQPKKIFEDKNGNSIIEIFNTREVVVHEINIKTKVSLNDLKCISSLFLFKGNIRVFNQENDDI
ncbi:hypothetical protein KKC59_02950, partial [bacterium]|nr:hypothetical protein [bacterium]